MSILWQKHQVILRGELNLELNEGVVYTWGGYSASDLQTIDVFNGACTSRR